MEFIAVVLRAHPPKRDPFNIGVFVVDETTDRLLPRFRTDIADIVDANDAEVLQGMPTMLMSMASEMGAAGLLSWLEDCASNMLRLETRVPLQAASPHQALTRAFSHAIATLATPRT